MTVADPPEERDDAPATTVVPVHRGPAAGRTVLVLYVATTFLGATLLFLVEPMVTKLLLPTLGGSAAVWNTALVFFQTVLLGGYAFAHVTLHRLGPRRQTVVQLVALVLALLTLPVALPAGWRSPSGAPEVWTLAVLTLMVGAPFLVLSTAGPTLQRWFSATSHPHAHDPYFLYAAGNVGSLLALLSYPLLIEPALPTDTQSAWWSAGYVTFVVLSAVCAVVVWRRPAPIAVHRLAALDDAAAEARPAVEAAPAITARTRLRWIGLAAIPSALLLGVTRHIATDVASMPLLWVIPLALYLVTFIVAFGPDPRRPVRVAARALKLLVIPLALSFFGLVGSLWIVLGLHLTAFFCAAMVAHGRLSEERPGPDRLTEFYLLLSVGGMVGGVLTALVAPLVFPSVLEYPIAIVLALAVLPASAFGAPADATTGDAAEGAAGTDVDEHRTDPHEHADDGRRRRAVVLGAAVVLLALASVAIRAGGTQQELTLSILVAALAAGGAYALARTPAGFAAAIGALLLVAVAVPANPTRFQERTFFGVHRVYDDAAHLGRHVLLNGTTVHGMEQTTGTDVGRPLTYYFPTGPIGQWFGATTSQPGPRHVGVIGLGSGALAAYGRAGDAFTYYEIDQAVVDISRDPSLFSFVAASPATVDMRVGDGRLELAATPDRYDLLVVDAFSGDSIPLHLMTDEAVGLYADHLTAGGVLAFHISNRYFDFAPILARLAQQHGLTGLIQEDTATDTELEAGKLDSTWVLLAVDPAALDPVRRGPSAGRWEPLADRLREGTPLWTDAYSDLLHVFRWQG